MEAANITSDLPIRELALIEDMSLRTVNCCLASGISTLGDLLDYKKINRNFLKIRNCGSISNQELIEICNYYDDQESAPIELSSIEWMESIDLQTLSLFEKMSARSYNACKAAGITSLQLLLQYYLESEKQFFALENCGAGTNNELVNICEKYMKSLISNKKDDEQSHVERFIPLDLFISNLKPDKENDIKLKALISSTDHIPIFAIINFLIDNHYIFKKPDFTSIFKQLCNCYIPNEDHTLQEVGNKLNVSIERIRQIRLDNVETMTRSLGFVKKLTDKVNYHKYIDIAKPLIFLTTDVARAINEKEHTHFSPVFISFILSMIYSEEYEWFGNDTTFFEKESCIRKKIIRSPFIIHKDIPAHFNLEKFVKQIYFMRTQSRFEDLKIQYPALFKKFYRTKYSNEAKTIAVIETIITSELNGKIGIEPDGLIFYKNKGKSILHLIIEILRQNDKPLHFTHIHNIFIQRGIPCSIEAVHYHLLNETQIFGLKGQGIFDLKSRGKYFGTIGDVAEQVLLNRKAPIPKHELVDIISEELLVARVSIMTTLFSYKHEKRFLRLSNGDIGLRKWESSKKYY